jgi:hypothetical protein
MIRSRLRGVVIVFAVAISSSVCGCASSGIKTTTGELAPEVLPAFESGEARLTCGAACSGTWGATRRRAKSLHEAALWKDLAIEVSKVGFDEDLTYFYLGRAAEGLRRVDAARTYYRLALASGRKCDRLFNLCDGFVFPGDILAGLDRLPQPRAETSPPPPEPSPPPSTTADNTGATAALTTEPPTPTKTQAEPSPPPTIEASPPRTPASQNEPDGFRGIKWGTNIKNLKDMHPTGEQKQGDRSYRRTGDKMSIGDASIQTITYTFYKDRFFSVFITYEGWTNFDSLKRTLFELYGQPSRPNQFMEEYHWWGAWVSVGFKYSEISKKGHIIYIYKSISAEREKDKKDSAKKGAADL